MARRAVYRHTVASSSWNSIKNKESNTTNKSVKTALALATTLAAGLPYALASDFSPYVDETGAISFPDDFRTGMVHLGSWFVADGAASGFHDVYTEKATVEAYRKTGKFPDGATLVKELRAHKTGPYTTGDKVSHATADLKQWFVMIKDAEGRFPDNPSWGDGWGWALYKPEADSASGGGMAASAKTAKAGVNVSADYQADCLGCHVPARATDLIYIEAYPTLAGQ